MVCVGGGFELNHKLGTFPSGQTQVIKCMRCEVRKGEKQDGEEKKGRVKRRALGNCAQL